MLNFLRRIRNIMTVRTARMTASRISHCASGPTPKMIGIGPMMMIPPTLVEPACENAAAMVTSITPRRIIENPRMKRASNFRGQFSSAGSGICAVAPGLFGQEIKDYDQYYEECCEGC